MTARQSMFMVIPTALALGWAGSVAAQFPATGQTKCYDSFGTEIACLGTGQDGAIQAGATLNYTVNGNGTITDPNTGLVWEKKSDDASIHNVNNTYTWDDAFAVHVAALNNTCANNESIMCTTNAQCGVGGTCGFAGERDWRLPNYKELTSILNLENLNPAVSAEFNTNCVTGVSVTGGSCAAASFYWSSTSVASDPLLAWLVDFGFGSVSADGKFNSLHVRAVRGGSP